MNTDVLRQHITELETELRTIHRSAGDRNLNPAQQTRWDAATADLTQSREALATAEAEATRRGTVAQDRARWGSVQVGTVVPAANHDAADVARMNDATARAAARSIFDDQRRSSAHLSTTQGDHLDALLGAADKNTDGSWIARAILLSETDAYRSAWQRLLTDPYPVLTGAESEALRAFTEFRAASIGTDAAGGFGVPVLIDPTVILTDQQSGNPVKGVARRETITTSEWKGVSSAGVSWSWDAEAAEVSDDTPTLAQPTVGVHTARGFVPYSIEVGMDYPNFAKEFGRLLAEEFDELTAEAFITGSGTGQPTGILTALDANTNVEVVVTTDGTFSATDVDKTWTALPDRAKGGATWLLSTDVESYISLWGDAFGGRTVSLGEQLAGLRGKPHITSAYMPSFTGTTGDANILVVGDFTRYLIAYRASMAVELVPHLFGTTNGRPTGQRGLFAHARVGADSIDDTAFRLLQNQA